METSTAVADTRIHIAMRSNSSFTARSIVISLIAIVDIFNYSSAHIAHYSCRLIV